MNTTISATEFCENVLEENWGNCEAKGLPASWTLLKDRFLERRCELQEAYGNIHQQTGGCPRQTFLFFDSLMCAVFAWNPEVISSMRSDKKRLPPLNQKIAEIASKLSTLLAERNEIEGRNGFDTGTHYHIVDVIEEASEHNYIFQSWVKDDLKALSVRYDMKYWPSLPEVIEVIATDAEQATVSTENRVTQAALDSTRTSKADFCRALMQRVNEEAEGTSVFPKNFALKDESWATLVNCALDLDADELIDGAYIKRLRQRSREMSRAQQAPQAQPTLHLSPSMPSKT